MDKPIKVFILEDLKTDQYLIKRQITKFAPDAVFTIASSGKEFKEKLAWGVPDIILSDYQLPDYNGLEALLFVREKIPHIPFVFVTGLLNNEETVADTILEGAAGYILKDNLGDIPTKIPAILQRYHQRLSETETKKQKERKKQLLLQKATALLEQSDNFSGKAELLSVLNEIESL